jgi:oligoendopeptidase F
MTISAPRWDLSNVYPSLESKEFKAAIEDYKKQVAALERFFKNKLSKADARAKVKDLAPLVGKAIDQINKIQTLSATIVPFIYSYVSTDSRDKLAMKTLSEFEQASLPMNQLMTRFTAWLGKVGPKLDQVTRNNKSAAAHAFMLREAAEQSKYLMSEAEEALAAEMSLSGGNAFEKLQGTVTSQLAVDFELDGKTQKLPMPALINLRSHPDEATRRRGYEAENKAWEEVKETLAACLNGVKGEANTLNKKRGRRDAIHSSLDAARMDRKTLEAMLTAMKDSFPMFRRYCESQKTGQGKDRLVGYLRPSGQD